MANYSILSFSHFCGVSSSCRKEFGMLVRVIEIRLRIKDKSSSMEQNMYFKLQLLPYNS